MKTRKHVTIRRQSASATYSSSQLVLPSLLPTLGIVLVMIGLGAPDGLVFTAAVMTITMTMLVLYYLSYSK